MMMVAGWLPRGATRAARGAWTRAISPGAVWPRAVSVLGDAQAASQPPSGASDRSQEPGEVVWDILRHQGRAGSCWRRRVAGTAEQTPSLVELDPVRPAVALGGMSMASFWLVAGGMPPRNGTYLYPKLGRLCSSLKDENEYLEDTNHYLTMFVERQKDKIEELQREVGDLKRLLRLIRRQ